MIRAVLQSITVALGLAGATLVAHAEPSAGWHPDRPVTIVVPYAPGGATDATARVVAQRLTSLWNQTVIVDNKPGADGLIGTRAVMDAKPDGYTLLMQVASLMLTKHQPGLKGVDPLARLVPVSNVAQSSLALVVPTKLPVKTLPELLQYCLKETSCSSGGAENFSKIFTKQFALAYGLKSLPYIPYRGTGAVVTDVVGGNLSMGFIGLAAALPHYRSGALRVIAVLGRQRARSMPDVPTAGEVDLKTARLAIWVGLFAPRDVPKPVIAAVAQALRESRSNENVRTTLGTNGLDVVMSTPDEFAKQLRDEDGQITALVRQFPLD